MLYYKSNKEYEILHIIDLQTVHSLHSTYYNRKHPNCISIIVSAGEQTRMYVLDAGSVDDQRIWISCLARVFKQILPLVLDLGSISINSDSSQNAEQQQNELGSLFNLEELEKSWWDDAFQLLLPNHQFPLIHSSSANTKNQLQFNDAQSPQLPDILEAEDEDVVEEDDDNDRDDDPLSTISPATTPRQKRNDMEDDLNSHAPTANFSSAIVSSAHAEHIALDSTRGGLKFPVVVEQQVALMSSHLLKRTDSQSQRDWDQRWFVLRGTNLMWYRDQNEYQLANMLPLSQVIDIIPYFERRSTGSRIKKIIAGKKQDTEKLVKIGHVYDLMETFSMRIMETRNSNSKDDFDSILRNVKQECWSDFLLAHGNVIYAMELLLACTGSGNSGNSASSKRYKNTKLVLATSEVELFEKWMVQLCRGYLSAHLLPTGNDGN